MSLVNPLWSSGKVHSRLYWAEGLLMDLQSSPFTSSLHNGASMNTPFQLFHSLPAFPCSQRPINTHHQHPPVQLSALRSTQWVSSPGTTSSCYREMPSAERHSPTSDSAGSNRSKVKRKKKRGGKGQKVPKPKKKPIFQTVLRRATPPWALFDGSRGPAAEAGDFGHGAAR